VGALFGVSAGVCNLVCDLCIKIAKILFTHGLVFTDYLGDTVLDKIIKSFFVGEADLVFVAEFVDKEGCKLFSLLLLLEVDGFAQIGVLSGVLFGVHL